MEWFSGLIVGTLVCAGVNASSDETIALQKKAETPPRAVPLVEQTVTAKVDIRSLETAGEKLRNNLAVAFANQKTDSQGGADKGKPNGKEKDSGKPAERKPLKRRVLVFKASWCGACQSLNYEWPKLRKVRWRIGTSKSDHFQFVDADQRPDLISKYSIGSLPTLVLVDGDQETGRRGGLNAVDMAEFYYGRLR